MKKVLITGGTRGIGEAAVRRFITGGYDVYFIYRCEDDLARALEKQTGATGIRCDVSDSDAVKRASETVGRISVLVNNAGIAQIKMFSDITDDEWRKMFAVNTDGAYNCTKAFLSPMIHEKYGRIINVSSVWGIIGSSCEVHYSSSKAALIGMTKALAKELGPSGITVNCVAPGVIDTDMNKNLGSDTILSLKEQILVGRLGRPDEIAELIYFLASEQAGYITGQVIAADGGFAGN